MVEIICDAFPHLVRHPKLHLYERSGVQEYWIVTPWPSMIEMLSLHEQRYRVQHVFGKEDELNNPTFPDLKIALSDVFNFPLEPGAAPPVVHEPPSPRYASQTR